MYKENFGKDQEGSQAELITLTNAKGTEVKISTLGATVVSFICRDKSGIMRDVVLGYDDADSYLVNRTYHFGATVGRNANRISNAEITIDGVRYQLEANSGSNNLHSGSNGVSHRMWKILELSEADNSVTLGFFSADLEQGFPGNMDIKVTYKLMEDNSLCIAYDAVSDKDTVANFTNHSYFNLAGHDSGPVGSQKMKLYAREFTRMAPTESIPTGEISPVASTPLDFTKFKEIGREIDEDYDQLVYMKGYDHNFVLDNGGKLSLMAEAVCEETGIHLYAYTDCPGVHFYTGNYIDEHTGKNGVSYGERHGFCLESQYFPDAFHNPGFLKPLLKAGEAYHSETVYKLEVEA